MKSRSDSESFKWEVPAHFPSSRFMANESLRVFIHRNMKEFLRVAVEEVN
jgi:hypothetical protein